MVYKNEVYGSFFVCFKHCHPFTEEDKSLAEFIGNDAGQVITIHRLHLSYYKKAERDSQRLLKQKNEFFNIASHELKTPVTTIKGFSQMLTERLENEKKKTDPTTKYFLNKINVQVDKLSHLVNDLLDVSRIETGKIKSEKVNFELSGLVNRTVDDLRIIIGNHPISFKSDYKFWVHGNQEHIERVLTNLINNAAKYSPSHAKIKVCLTLKNEWLRVEVEDFGFGIKEKDKAKVFNRFFQSKDNYQGAFSGMGLGLYIANSIIKYHGGSIGFESKKKTKGTIFYFTLPYYKYRKLSKKKHG